MIERTLRSTPGDATHWSIRSMGTWGTRIGEELCITRQVILAQRSPRAIEEREHVLYALTAAKHLA